MSYTAWGEELVKSICIVRRKWRRRTVSSASCSLLSWQYTCALDAHILQSSQCTCWYPPYKTVMYICTRTSSPPSPPGPYFHSLMVWSLEQESMTRPPWEGCSSSALRSRMASRWPGLGGTGPRCSRKGSLRPQTKNGRASGRRQSLRFESIESLDAPGWQRGLGGWQGRVPAQEEPTSGPAALQPRRAQVLRVRLARLQPRHREALGWGVQVPEPDVPVARACRTSKGR